MLNKDEQEFRDRLYDYESPADPEAIWAAVQGGLTHQPKRSRRWLWWLPLLLLLAGAAYGVGTMAEGAGPQVQSGLKERGGAPFATRLPSEVPRPLSPGEEGRGRSDNSLRSNSPNENQPDNERQRTNKNRKVNGPGATNENRKASTKYYAANLPASAESSEPPTYERSEHTTPPTSPLSLGEGPGEWTAEHPTHERSEHPTPPTSPLSPGEGPGERTTPPTPPLSPPLKFRPQTHRPWSLTASGTYSLLRGDPTVTGIVDTIVSSPQPEADNPYRALEAVGTDLLLAYTTRSGWRIRGGVGVTRINSVAERVSSSPGESRLMEGIVRLDVQAGGDTTAVTGLIGGTVHSVRTQRHYNRINLIDVPLLLGKTFRHKRFRFGVEAGVVLNVRSFGSVRYLQNDGEFTDRTSSDAILRSSLGVSLRAGLSLGYRLTPRLGLSFGLRYRGIKNGPLERSAANVWTKYGLAGSNLGVKYHF